MRTFLPSAAAVILLVSYPSPALANDPADSIDSYVAQRMESTGVPGAAVSVIEGGKVTHSQQYGHTPAGEAITAHTPFQWGSVAKPITASIVLSLAEDGKLDVDDPAEEYLEDFRPTWRGKAASPTIAQLLSHTAGLPEVGALDVTDRTDHRRGAVSKVANELNDVELSSRPGSEYTYTSLDYILLGAIVEQASGKPYPQVARERVFAPLDAKNVIMDASQADRLPGGHRLWFGYPRAYTGNYDNSGVAYGYMSGDITALTRFTAAAAQRDAVISDASWHEAQSTQTKTDDGAYGYGWSIRQWHGETMLFHTGAAAGYHTNVIVLPQRDTAIVLLQNTYSEAAALPLRSTSEGVASIVSGRTPDASEPADSTLTVAPWVLAALAIVLLSLSLIPPRRRGRVRAIAWGASAVILPLALWWGTPAATGVQWRFLWLFTPDLALGIVAVSAGVFILSTRRAVAALRQQRTEVASLPKRREFIRAQQFPPHPYAHE